MDIGTGTTISFESGFLAEILDISPPNPSRVSIPTSHMGTSADHTFTPGKLVDWGECTVEMAFAPGTTIPIDQDPSECVITFPDSAATTWTFDAFMTGLEPSDPLEDRMTASVTLKVTGGVTPA